MSTWFKDFWTGFSQASQELYEKKLLHKWGKVRTSKVMNVQISSDPNDTIHSISVNCDGVKQPFLLVPGYGAPSGMYYKLMNKLGKRYDLHVVDMRGMGCSGRPEFTARSKKEAEDYLIEGIEKWRTAVGLNGKAILCGHSLGAYVATQYALKNEDKISALVLVSPAGLNKKPTDFEQRTAKFEKNPIKRYFLKQILKYWKPGSSPFELVRRLGRVAKLGLWADMQLMRNLVWEERNDLVNYIYQTLAQKGTGELAMAYLLEPGAYAANEPLVELITRLRVPVYIFYGDNDWVEALQMKEEKRVKPVTIVNATHRLHVDNPKGLAKGIVSHLSVNPIIVDKATKLEI